MESLTKTQLILLTLLLSFVTSIATGIMTTSLLQSAPTNVTQTINRVVERTIEKVSDSAGVTKEVQVVSEDDRVTGAIVQNAPSLVSIRQIQGSGSSNFYSVGVIYNKDGEVLTEKTSDFIKELTYTGLLSNGTTINLTYEGEVVDAGIIVFKINNTSNQKIVPANFTKALPKLGQTVILMEGIGGDLTALVGRVALIQGDSSTTPRTIVTDIDSAKNSPGAPILDLSGNILGIRRTDVSGGKAFFYAPRILSLISK